MKENSNRRSPLILVVDDDRTTHRMITGILNQAGFQTASAADIASAWAKIRESQPELVLLDVSMPFQTGLQALPEILAACPGVRVVMVTSIADQGTVTECLEKGAAGYIRKDASLAEIDRLLAELREEVTPPQLPGVPHARL